MLRSAVAGTQGSAIAQLNLAWLLQHGQAYEGADSCKLQVCQHAAAHGGLPKAWVDAGNLADWQGSTGTAASRALVGINNTAWASAMTSHDS